MHLVLINISKFTGYSLIGMIEDHGRVKSKYLEAKVRTFLNKCFSLEAERKGSPEAEDHFATLEIKCLMMIQKIKEKTPEPEGEAAVNDQTESNKDSKKKKRTVRAQIVDPFKNIQKKSYDCPYCSKSYDASSIKSLQFHCRKHHPDKPKLSKNDFEVESEVECELITRKGKRCGSSYPRHQLRRHLERKKIHKNPQRKPDGKVFRAWRFVEDDVEVLWKATADEEIPSEEDVEVEEEMIVEDTEVSINEDKAESVPEAVIDNEVDQESNEVDIANPVEPEKEKGHAIKMSQKVDTSSDENVPELPEQSENFAVDVMDFEINQSPHTENAPVEPEKEKGQTKMGQDVEETFPDPRLDFEAASADLELINDESEPTRMTVDYEDGDQNLIQTSQELEICQTSNLEEETFFPVVGIVSPAAIETCPPNSCGTEAEKIILVNPNLIQSSSDEYDGTEVIEYIVEPPVSVCQIDSSVFMSSAVQDCAPEGATFVPEHDVEVEVQSDNTLGSDLYGIDELLNDSTSGAMRNLEQETSMIDKNLYVDMSQEEENSMIDEDGLNQVIMSTSQETVYEEQKAASFETVKDKLLNEDRKRVRFRINNQVFSCQGEKIQDDNLTKETESDSEESDVSIDSDYDEDLDSDTLITKKRQERKKVRLMNRNKIEASIDLTEIKENKDFIQDFKRWLTSKTSLQTTNPKPDNLTSKMGHAFSYHDSFLNYMTRKNAEFNLNRLIDFKNKDNFLAIESPVEWISCAAGPDKTANPTRNKEQLKTHATLRSFVSHKLNLTAFDGNDILLTMVINNQLQAIEKEVSDSKLFAKFRALYEKDKNKAKRMKVIANPSIHQLEFESVRTWFASKEARDREAEFRKICKEALKAKKIAARNFGKAANLGRFTLAIKDRNRPSSYDFSNLDYNMKIPCWLPQGTENLWSLESLPPGWKMFEEREEPPTCFIISLDGTQAKIKLQAETTIIIDMKTYEILELYQDLKKMLFGKLPPTSPFFINHKGNQLSRLQRCPGSLVELFGKTVGLPDFKMTDARKQLEGVVQGSREAKNTKDINNHSSSVGSAVYDNTKQMRRSVFMMSSMAETESSCSVDKEEVQNHYNLRVRGDKEARDEVESQASKFLDQRKKKKPVENLSPTSLKKEDISFMRKIFTDVDIKGKLYIVLM